MLRPFTGSSYMLRLEKIVKTSWTYSILLCRKIDGYLARPSFGVNRLIREWFVKHDPQPQESVWLALAKSRDEWEYQHPCTGCSTGAAAPGIHSKNPPYFRDWAKGRRKLTLKKLNLIWLHFQTLFHFDFSWVKKILVMSMRHVISFFNYLNFSFYLNAE